MRIRNTRPRRSDTLAGYNCIFSTSSCIFLWALMDLLEHVHVCYSQVHLVYQTAIVAKQYLSAPVFHNRAFWLSRITIPMAP
jgi:hypothetical protein